MLKMVNVKTVIERNSKNRAETIKEKSLRNYSDKVPLLLITQGYGGARIMFRSIVLNALRLCPFPAVNLPTRACDAPVINQQIVILILGFKP